MGPAYSCMGLFVAQACERRPRFQIADFGHGASSAPKDLKKK
jgi:hypothetical protein